MRRKELVERDADNSCEHARHLDSYDRAVKANKQKAEQSKGAVSAVLNKIAAAQFSSKDPTVFGALTPLHEIAPEKRH